MCFAPQRRALFRHLNFQKWSDNGVFCTFWLRNVLRATTACNFSSLIWPAGSAPAALASLLFDPPEPQIIGKTQGVSRLSYLFAHLHLLSSDSFSSTILSSNLFSSLCLCPTLLFICPYCRKFDFSTPFDNYNCALHPIVAVEVTTATTPKNTTPTTIRSISGFALPSMPHNNSHFL